MQLAKKRSFFNNNSSSIPSYVTENLVGWWDGEYNAGIKTHSNDSVTWVNLGSSGSAYNATRSQVSWGENYANFNGSSLPKFMTIGYGFLSNVLSQEWTIEMTFEPNSGWFQNFSGIFGPHGNGNGIVGGQYESGYISFATHSNTLIFYKPVASAFTANNMYVMTMAASASSGIAKAFKNGTKVNQISGSSSQITLTNSDQVRIGSGWYDDTRDFHGKIFCIRCYNRMLTDEEIVANFDVDKKRFGVA